MPKIRIGESRERGIATCRYCGAAAMDTGDGEWCNECKRWPHGHEAPLEVIDSPVCRHCGLRGLMFYLEEWEVCCLFCKKWDRAIYGECCPHGFSPILRRELFAYLFGCTSLWVSKETGEHGPLHDAPCNCMLQLFMEHDRRLGRARAASVLAMVAALGSR